MRKTTAAVICAAMIASTGALAQTSAPAAKPAGSDPNSLKIMFSEGSAAIEPRETAVLDKAARLYRDGNPIVMVIAGSADSVGRPDANLTLSQRRAEAVLKGLVARGIPVERFQITARGETEPAVPASPGTPEPANRYAEITWR